MDVHGLVTTLVQLRVSMEELLGRALRNLYSLETRFMSPNVIDIRNSIRSSIAYVKVMYDFGQQMSLARLYLMHKIRLLEARVSDINAEISVLRGGSSPGEPSSGKNLSQEFVDNNRIQVSDDEVEILMDTRMINEIDQSKFVLQNIGQQIADKKQELMEIEKCMDDASILLSVSSDLKESSSLNIEQNFTHSSDGNECTHEFNQLTRSRDGVTRIMSPNYITMAMSENNEFSLLSQGDFGASRDRHGGEPDAAGSIVLGRESCEGTVEVASASASTAQVATAELNNDSNKELVHSCDQELQMEIQSSSNAGEKRKASVSPGSETEMIGSRRPNKARIVESEEVQDQDVRVYLEDHNEDFDENAAADAMLPSSSPEACGITKKSLRNLGSSADFSALKEARLRKQAKELAIDEKDKKSLDTRDLMESMDSSSVGEIEEIARSTDEQIEKRDTELEESDDSSVVESLKSPKPCRTRRNKLESNKYLEPTSDSADDCMIDRDTTFKSNKKSNKIDKTVKNPVQRGRRKTSIPEIVSKDETEQELRYTREKWLQMDGAALGSRCLDYLAELDRQRSLCSNLSGQVNGWIKDTGLIASEITKALIEKLMTVGDVYGLKNENFSLKEEVNELKRKEQAQSKEMISLRKTISQLEREVRSLKEGIGPFVAMTPPQSSLAHKKPKLTERKSGKQRERERESLTRDSSREVPMETELLMSGTQGCSTDMNYMQRKDDWQGEEDPVFWNDNDYSSYKTATITTSLDHKVKISKNELANIKNVNATSPRGRGIKIIDNRQLVPPSFPLPPNPNAEWSAVGRGGRTLPAQTAKNYKRPYGAGSPDVRPKKRILSGGANAGKPGKRLIKPAVVTITGKPGGLSYAQILAKAREKVSLSDLGIQNTVIRRAMNGAIVIEVSGPQGKQLAGTLSTNLAAVLGEEARVLNPVAMGELRLRGIDPSTTAEEIRVELEALSGCNRQDLRVSPVNTMRDGMGVAWVKCPLEIAVRLAEKGAVALGWTRVKIELLKKKPVQCFKCWCFGHVRTSCRSEIDRTGACFRCGLDGHNAGFCNAGMPKCIVCEEGDFDSRHRLGSPRCLANQGFPSGIQPIRKSVSSTAGGAVGARWE